MDANTPLKKIIICCQDKNCDQFQLAWSELERRFSQIIRGAIRYACKSRLRRDFSATVNDIYSMVWRKLQRNIVVFDVENREAAFNAWLWAICNKEVSTYLKSAYSRRRVSADEATLERIGGSHNDLYEAELYEWLVFHLRKHMAPTSVFQERNIQIFYLKKYFGLSAETLLQHPCIGAGVRKSPRSGDNSDKESSNVLGRVRHNIDVVISRLRNLLKHDRDFLDGLTER